MRDDQFMATSDAAKRLECTPDNVRSLERRGKLSAMRTPSARRIFRAKNRVNTSAKTTTADHDILRRYWLLVDCDAVRPTEISSNEAEHHAALDRRCTIAAWLSSHGWPEPVHADSGNGAHLLYPIDLPNDAASRDLVKAALEVLALKFTDATVAIDTTVFNAARITKPYGTMSCKGDSTEDRPHRRSHILSVPDPLVAVPDQFLQELAQRRPTDPKPIYGGKNGTRFDVQDFIARHGLAIAYEKPWGNGRALTLEHCPFNPDHRRDSSILVFSSGAFDFKCFHNSCQSNRWQQLRDLLEPDRYRARPPKHANGPESTVTDSGDGLIVVRLSSVQPESIRWLWPRRIARGKLNLVIGDPGLGKSLLTIDAAARVTTGKTWPDGGATDIGDVIMLTAEDGLADTIRPRMDQIKGDVERVQVIKAYRERGQDRQLCLGRDLPAIESLIHQTKAVLLTIDPLSAYLGNIDSKTDAEVRGTLAPLATLAEQTGVAVFGVMHLNKNSQQKAIYRALSSIAFVAAARIVLAVAKDPNNPQRRYLAPVKVNVCAPPATLAYRITESGLLVWEQEPVGDLDADTILGTHDDQIDRHSKTEAAQWLREYLRDGERPATSVIKAADQVGISKRTLERAKAVLQIKQRRVGFGNAGQWFWYLPDTSSVGDQWNNTACYPLKTLKDAHTPPTSKIGEQLAWNGVSIDRQSADLANNGRSLDITTPYIHTSPIDRQTDNLEEVDLRVD